MSARDKTPPKFAVGTQVRVKTGVTAPSYPDMPLDGWCGKVYEVNGKLYLVHWDGDTMEAIHPVYLDRRKRDGMDFRVMWLHEKVLEADSAEP